MKISVDDSYKEQFIYSIPRYIKYSINSTLNNERCIRFKEEFNIDVKDVLNFAISNIIIRHIKNEYIIEIDRNKFYKDMNIEKLINLITYGNRNVKGYKILLNIFDFISNNIDLVYRRWQSNGY